MQTFSNLTRTLTSKADLAKLFGLSTRAKREAISSAFGQATNFDAWLMIEDHPVTTTANECWEVRVIEALPRCRLELRAGARGEWLRSAEGVPADVLSWLGARVARDGGIETDRRWKTWQKMNWTGRTGRRLRARQGEIQAVVEIPAVRRATGTSRLEVVLEAIGAPQPETIKPLRIALPCKVGDIDRAVRSIRRMCEDQMVPA